MRQKMFSQKIRITEQIVVYEENQLTNRRSPSDISCSCLALVWLLKNSKTTRWFESAQHVHRAVRRAVHNNHDFVLFSWEVLLEESLQRT